MSNGIIEAAQNKLKEKGIEEIDIRFTDIQGYWRHVTLPVSSAPSDLFLRGVGFDGSTLAGMSSTEAGDLALIPDPRSSISIPSPGNPPWPFSATSWIV